MCIWYTIFAFVFALHNCQNHRMVGINQIRGEVVGDLTIRNFTTVNHLDSAKDSVLIFTFSNDTLIQMIDIEPISNTIIHFTLYSKNKKSQQTAEISGTATCNDTADPEIDEDENGFAYPAQQYLSDGSCQLSIRLDMLHMDKVRTVLMNCEEHKHSRCPFESIGLLRRNVN